MTRKEATTVTKLLIQGFLRSQPHSLAGPPVTAAEGGWMAAAAEAAAAAGLGSSVCDTVLSRTEAPVKIVPDATTGPAAASMTTERPCAGSAALVS
jgi:hypothetical protein